jgi:hypothetical protein
MLGFRCLELQDDKCTFQATEFVTAAIENKRMCKCYCQGSRETQRSQEDVFLDLRWEVTEGQWTSARPMVDPWHLVGPTRESLPSLLLREKSGDSSSNPEHTRLLSPIIFFIDGLRPHLTLEDKAKEL